MLRASLILTAMVVFLCVTPTMPVKAADPFFSPAADTCDGQVPGDANGDGFIDISDSRYLTVYLCLEGPAPMPLANGDPNGDCIIDSLDIAYIIAYIFQGGPAPVECTCLEPVTAECWADSCDLMMPGDANGDGFIDIADSRYLVNYICLDGPGPNPTANGDPNGDCIVDSLDIAYIIAYIFQGGEVPVDCTCLNPEKGDCWVDTCEIQMPGDATGNGSIAIDDPVYLGQYLCRDGAAPSPLANGDPNGDCVIDSLDLEYLIDYMFRGGPAPVDCTCLFPETGNCPQYHCGDNLVGDANDDDRVNVGDAVYLINYVFKGPAPKPYPYYSGDTNCDCAVNIGDAVFVINYVFKGGPAPCGCEGWLGQCGPPLR